jgi:hypothetical protein
VAEERNNILQKAIRLYLNSRKLNYNNAILNLSAFQEKAKRDDNWNMQYGSTAEQLKQYKVVVCPPDDEWVLVEKDEKRNPPSELFFRQVKK